MQPWAYLSACMLMWGLATFAMKLAGTRLDPITIVVCNVVGYLLVGLALLPQAQLALSWSHALSAAIGCLFVLGNLAFYKLAQTQQVSSLAPLTALYVAVPVVLGLILLKETLALRKGAGIVLALAALYLLAGDE